MREVGEGGAQGEGWVGEGGAQEEGGEGGAQGEGKGMGCGA